MFRVIASAFFFVVGSGNMAFAVHYRISGDDFSAWIALFGAMCGFFTAVGILKD